MTTAPDNHVDIPPEWQNLLDQLNDYPLAKALRSALDKRIDGMRDEVKAKAEEMDMACSFDGHKKRKQPRRHANAGA